MFDLNEEVRKWQESFRGRQAIRPEDLEELASTTGGA